MIDTKILANFKDRLSIKSENHMLKRKHKRCKMGMCKIAVASNRQNAHINKFVMPITDYK